MKVLIIEDEKPAADKLEILLQRYDPEIEILGKIQSVEQSVIWLGNPPSEPDLLFLDINLSDGSSFEIFNQVTVEYPIIFTTAYNEFAIDAFKHNSIDYLLKPIDYDDLYRSLEKFKNFKEKLIGSQERIKYEEINDLISSLKKNYKTRFMIKVGEHIKSITTDKIVLFYAEGRNVSVLTQKGREYIIDYKLEELENILNPNSFFRVSRSFIININAITDVIIYSNSRLKIKIEQEFEREIIVSREKVNEFKYWFDGQE